MTGIPSPGPSDLRTLDNAVWHSLVGPRAALAERRAGAAAFDPAVSPFSAVTDRPGPGDWADLAALVGPGRGAVLFGAPTEIPTTWRVAHRAPCVQMVARGSLDLDLDDLALLELGAPDVPEMLALAEATHPGPFLSRTVELGGYLGVRDGGRLVAMAGERLRVPGHTEISAVCTDAEHRGRGLASALVRALVHRIRARGEEAFLHTDLSNTVAIRLYDELGFELRREVDATIVVPPA